VDRVNPPRDEELLQAAGRGDLAAFEQLVLRYQSDGWRVAYRFTGDAAQAEDLTQDVFLRIFDAAPRYRPTASFRTYFYRVLGRLCMDYRRRKRPLLGAPLETVADDACPPNERASLAERDRCIQAALDALPADYRLAVVLRYFEGLSGAEIATAMGRSVKAVERVLARAKSALEPQLRRFLDT
jgi:RNA polymerase sigma-70 factor (ECF subfamily)